MDTSRPKRKKKPTDDYKNYRKSLRLDNCEDLSSNKSNNLTSTPTTKTAPDFPVFKQDVLVHKRADMVNTKEDIIVIRDDIIATKEDVLVDSREDDVATKM